MKNIAAILGIVACLLSCAVLGSSLLLPMALSPFSSFFCEEDETLSGEVRTIGNEVRSSTGTAYICTDKNGNERAVTSSVVAKTTNLFLVLLFGGMGLLAVGGWNAIKNAPPTNKTKRKNDDRTDFDEPQPFTPDDKLDLTDSLRELEEAHTAGLITEDEYQRMRQKVMERFE
jgi:hypothetical protein